MRASDRTVWNLLVFFVNIWKTLVAGVQQPQQEQRRTQQNIYRWCSFLWIQIGTIIRHTVISSNSYNRLRAKRSKTHTHTHTRKYKTRYSHHSPYTRSKHYIVVCMRQQFGIVASLDKSIYSKLNKRSCVLSMPISQFGLSNSLCSSQNVICDTV